MLQNYILYTTFLEIFLFKDLFHWKVDKNNFGSKQLCLLITILFNVGSKILVLMFQTNMKYGQWVIRKRLLFESTATMTVNETQKWKILNYAIS